MSLIQIQHIRAAKGLGVCLAWMALALAALAQSMSTTTVRGTVYLANGSPDSGILQISWPAFTTASNQTVAAGKITADIGTDGFVSVNLAPNQGSSPAGLYYTAVYHMSDGTTSTEYWVVPTAVQASIAQVRSQVMPAAQAVQAVSKAYVDQAIQSIAQGNLTSTGGQLTGPLYLTGDPTHDLQAADKHYVDASFAQALPVAGGTMTGPLTLSSPSATSANNQPANPLIWSAQYWNGSSSQPDVWSALNRLGSGTSPSSTLSFTHSGPGAGNVSFPGTVAAGALVGTSVSAGTTCPAPGAATLQGPITNGTWNAACYATGSSTGGISEAYAACVAAGNTGCWIQLSQPVSITSSQTVSAQNQSGLHLNLNGYTLACSQATGGCLTLVDANGITNRIPVEIYGGTIAYTGSGTNVVGLQIGTSTYTTVNYSIHNLAFNGFSTSGAVALNLVNAEDGHIYDNSFTGNTLDISLGASTNQTEINSNWMQAGTNAIILTDSEQNDFHHNLIQSKNGAHPVQVSAVTVNITHNDFERNWFENDGDGTSATQTVYMNAASGTSIIWSNFEGNIFNAGTGGAHGVAYGFNGAGSANHLSFKSNNYGGMTASSGLPTGGISAQDDDMPNASVGLNQAGNSGLNLCPSGGTCYQVFSGWPGNYGNYLQFWDVTNSRSIASWNGGGWTFLNAIADTGGYATPNWLMYESGSTWYLRDISNSKMAFSVAPNTEAVSFTGSVGTSNMTDTGAEASVGVDCLQINTSGLISNTGVPCLSINNALQPNAGLGVTVQGGSGASNDFAVKTAAGLPNFTVSDNQTVTATGQVSAPSFSATGGVSAGSLTDTGAEASSGVNCLQIDASGAVSNTGAPCFSASSNLTGSAGNAIQIQGGGGTTNDLVVKNAAGSTNTLVVADNGNVTAAGTVAASSLSSTNFLSSPGLQTTGWLAYQAGSNFYIRDTVNGTMQFYCAPGSGTTGSCTIPGTLNANALSAPSVSGTTVSAGSGGFTQGNGTSITLPLNGFYLAGNNVNLALQMSNSYSGANTWQLINGGTGSVAGAGNLCWWNGSACMLTITPTGAQAATFGISTKTTWDANGVKHEAGSSPTISGTGASLTNGTNAGGIVALSSSTTATITFANSGYSNWAACTGNLSVAASTATVYVSAQSKTACTFTMSASTTGSLYYSVTGN